MSEGYAQVKREAQARQAALDAWCREHFKQDETLVLELGCGHGHFLNAYAADYPGRTCLGVDLISRRVEKAQSKAAKHGLERLFFHKAEAAELLSSLASVCRLETIFMLFPDPWPKKRHHKNRMIQPALLEQLSMLTVPGGQFCFRTDHDGYFFWAVERLYAHPSWTISSDTAWPFEAPTVFQERMSAWRSLVAIRT
ncbi:MAG: tRNA (guanosine(46)-N7)-methyltransferase TrmB [Verrucomicrobiota bacterium]